VCSCVFNKPLRNFCAPSRHSGESSLSPSDPQSSEIRISARTFVLHFLISVEMIVTLFSHRFLFMSFKLKKMDHESHEQQQPVETYVGVCPDLSVYCVVLCVYKAINYTQCHQT